MPHSFYFGGTEDSPTGTSAIYFGGASYGITLILEEFDWLTSISQDVQDVPYGFGNASWGAHHPAKLFTLPCIVKGTSWIDVKAKLDAINLAIDKNRLGALRFDDMNDRYWLARLTGHSQVKIFSGGATFDLEFTAPDPRAYSTTETTQSVSLSSGTNSFNVPASGVIGGTGEVDPTWLIKPTGSGSTSMVLTNVTRDEALTYANTLTSAEWLRIKAHARQELAEKTADSGSTYSAVMGGVYYGSRFPKLSPNVANAMTLTGITSTGTLVITYRERYL